MTAKELPLQKMFRLWWKPHGVLPEPVLAKRCRSPHSDREEWPGLRVALVPPLVPPLLGKIPLALTLPHLMPPAPKTQPPPTAPNGKMGAGPQAHRLQKLHIASTRATSAFGEHATGNPKTTFLKPSTFQLTHVSCYKKPAAVQRLSDRVRLRAA